jgi:hypothetical protein
VQPFHVAAFVKELQGQLAPPTVKQHLAALRMLFDRLVTDHVIDSNPAHAVRGPKYVVTRGKTPVLTTEEALLDSIDPGTLTGLRDRALIGVMVYTFARVNAVIGMKSRTTSPRAAAAGYACTRRAASCTRCPATTRWKNCSTTTSLQSGSPTTRTAGYSVPQAARPARRTRCGSRTPIG